MLLFFVSQTIAVGLWSNGPIIGKVPSESQLQNIINWEGFLLSELSLFNQRFKRTTRKLFPELPKGEIFQKAIFGGEKKLLAPIWALVTSSPQATACHF